MDNALYLLPGAGGSCYDFVSYELIKREPFDNDYINFMPIVSDAFENIFFGMTAVSSFVNIPFLHPKTKLCLFNRQSVFWRNYASDFILAYLGLHPEHKCLFWKTENIDKKEKFPSSRTLHIAKENVTADFIKEAYMDTQYAWSKGPNFQFSTDGYILKGKSIVDAVADKTTVDVSVFYDATETVLHIQHRKSTYCV